MKVPATFSAAPMYARSISDAIKAQFRFLNNSLNDECSADNVMQLENAALVNGAIETEEDGKYSFDCPYFGEGDFTLEAKITFYSWGDANVAQPSYVFGQYDNGSLDVSTNSWNLRVHNGLLLWVERRGTTTANSPNTVSAERFAFQLNREYHVVVERVGGTLSLYVDGVFYASLASTTPLTNSPAPIMSEQIDPGTSTNGYGRCSRRIRDIRIASRALYRGNIYNNFSGIRESEGAQWWKGSVVAYDSARLELDVSHNFRDYNGVLMKAGKAGFGYVNGSFPQKGDAEFKYGTGILLSSGSYIVTNLSELLHTFAVYSWTLDFWHRDVDEGKTGRAGIFPVINYPNVEVASTYTSRFLIGPGNGDANAPLGKYTVWSNTAAPSHSGAISDNLGGTDWKHTAIVYDAQSKVLRFYSNGVLTGSVSITVQPILTPNQFGIGSTSNNRPVLIERYRLRLGMHFNGQFDPDNSY